MTPRLGRYFWKLFLINAALMALVLTVCVWGIMSQFDRFHERELSRHLFAQALTIEAAVRDSLDRSHAAELSALAKQIGSTEREGVRVTFVLADGTVLGDSEADPSRMESHADRPEIRQALATGFGESVRWSHTVSKNLKYVAVRVGSADDPRGVVRVSMAEESIAAQAQPAQRLTITIAGVAFVSAVLLGLALALLWSQRIRRIVQTARSLSRGDLSARVKVIGHDEVSVLGRSLNTMRARLARQLDTIDRQRRTLDSLVSQLREGVVVADADGRIVLINSEAVKLLHPTTDESDTSFAGLTVEQAVPQRQLQKMLRRAERDESPDTDDSTGESTRQSPQRPTGDAQEIELQVTTGAGVRSVLARAFDVRLPGAVGTDDSIDATGHSGRALVLTDITELTRIMRIKADLAANASHELRTPLSAIRAAVDTLRKIDWQDHPAAASRFIDVLDRHSARMEAMICDLLELSRLESGTSRFEIAPVSVRVLFRELRDSVADALAEKKLQWETSMPEGDVNCSVSVALLRMILRNLIDNAIRFTDPEGHVTLAVRLDPGAVTFEVADTGCGIPVDHQSRVFERFYQVEPARSGLDRGTGLGLSIVRHAATAMNATVDLQSRLGRGTRVTIRIPQPEAP